MSMLDPKHGSWGGGREWQAGPELPRGGEVSKDEDDMNENYKWHISINSGFAPEGLGNIFWERGA